MNIAIGSPLLEVTQIITAILPKDQKELERSIVEEGGVQGYLERLGILVQGVFERNRVDICSDDPYISEFRHIMSNAVVRIEKSGDNLNSVYFWMDVFRSNIQSLFD